MIITVEDYTVENTNVGSLSLIMTSTNGQSQGRITQRDNQSGNAVLRYMPRYKLEVINLLSIIT